VKATEIDENLAEAYSQLASLYNGMGKLDDAAKMSAKANELTAKSPAGGDPIALYNQGVILWNGGQRRGSPRCVRQGGQGGPEERQGAVLPGPDDVQHRSWPATAR
jgi:tetratricopeptide (TPR) repeat protein